MFLDFIRGDFYCWESCPCDRFDWVDFNMDYLGVGNGSLSTFLHKFDD